jgi:hypothetical protein
MELLSLWITDYKVSPPAWNVSAQIPDSLRLFNASVAFSTPKELGWGTKLSAVKKN